MNPGDEVLSPTAADPTPLPLKKLADHGAESRYALAAGAPTAEVVLRWIAASGSEPWFPSVHAKQTGTPRDSLDDPLSELRLAELVKIVTWVRGVGQGYALTPAGQAALADASVFARPPTLSDVPPTESAEGEPAPAVPSHADLLDLRPPVVTPALLIATVLWFFVGLVFAVRVGVPAGEYLWTGNPAVLARLGAVTGPDLLRGEWWRLASCCFVHFGAVHLALNMFILGVVGPLAELLWGRGRTAIIYAMSGLAGSCLAMALSPTVGGGVNTLAGASGAIWGVSTSLLAWMLLFGSRLPPVLARNLFRRLCLMLAMNAGISCLPHISWEAHLGGGLAGFLTAGLLNVARLDDRPRRRAAVVILVLLPVVCVTGLLTAMQSSPDWVALRAREAQSEAARREEQANLHQRASNEQVAARLPRITAGTARQAGHGAVREANRLWDEITSATNPKSEARNPKQIQNPDKPE
jgi:membrane associated rhomboid family serine protease